MGKFYSMWISIMCFCFLKKAECILYLGKRQEVEGDSEDKNPGKKYRLYWITTMTKPSKTMKGQPR